MEQITSLINSYLHEPHASLLNGILLGRPLFVTNTFYDQLKAVGLIHIVVLSGMNITLLSAIILQFLAPVIGRKIALVITIMVIIGFISFVGIEPPIVRAGIMGILSLVGLLYGRKTLALYTLLLSAIIMILIHRAWLTSISFQLSFAATLGIILFGNVCIDETLQKFQKRSNTFLFRFSSYFLEELRISLSAQVFTVPIIFYYFREISLISPIANILVSWIIAPVMIMGTITIAVGIVWWEGGFIIAWICHSMIAYIILVVETLAKIPYASIRF